ncbi:MAG: hypothetical protein IKD90_08615 [Clostridiales bacterium]|nr:hypothetical protein [Clostridiales bacterium]
MTEKACDLCGSEMQYDDFTRAWVCTVCGNSIADKRESEPAAGKLNVEMPAVPQTEVPSEKPDVDQAEVPVEEPAVTQIEAPTERTEATEFSSLEEAHNAILNKQFEKAGELLSDYRKNHIYDAKMNLLLLLCGYKASSTEELLRSISNSSIKLEKLAERADWEEMVLALPSDQQKFVKDVIEYCAISVVLLGDAKKLQARNKRQQKTVVSSSFAKMDKEEMDTMKRMEQLKRAQEMEFALESEKRQYQYEAQLSRDPVISSGAHMASVDTGSTGLNVVLDVLDFLFVDNDFTYDNRPLFYRTRAAAAKHAREQRMMAEEAVKKNYMQAKEPKKNTASAFLTAVDRLDKANISQEDLKSASETLLEEIRILEKQLLSI